MDRIPLKAVLLSVPMLLPVMAQANTLEQNQQVLERAHQQGAQAQRHIDQLDQQTRENYDAYTAALRQAELMEAYNRQLSRMVEDQRRELADVEAQLTSLTQTEQATLPLLVRMQSILEQFIASDLPFLPEEREQRVQRLARLLDRADISLAEKYRQILEAYRIEAEYGRTLEAWSGALEQGGQVREVTFLRLGRVALYYQTLDGEESGRWRRQSGDWERLDADFDWPIRKGVSMARQQSVPELLELPIELVPNEHSGGAS
ncbi:DUF3450 domain-containing protein [Marinobacterium weihaiense]|uniref:DUF3450 domain-containing protein n=1 Tax=Marinobacterium weihaiense TaxID=2851016 RepID=A0ABS6M9Z1_9GAMM|nr:DUF3450 domain-containing protein [Marinobacterium weihaiense]MBV0933103.1 DUF3450 domain-containing protein [Marinobacterium weihaiense]